jgi:hypothetical protein
VTNDIELVKEHAARSEKMGETGTGISAMGAALIKA